MAGRVTLADMSTVKDQEASPVRDEVGALVARAALGLEPETDLGPFALR